MNTNDMMVVINDENHNQPDGKHSQCKFTDYVNAFEYMCCDNAIFFNITYI